MTKQVAIPCIQMSGGTSTGRVFRQVISGGVIRTARKPMAGEVHVPAHLLGPVAR